MVTCNTYGILFLVAMLAGVTVFTYIKVIYSDYSNLDGFLLSVPLVLLLSKIAGKIVYGIPFLSLLGFSSVGSAGALCIIVLFMYDTQIDFIALTTSWAFAGSLIRIGNVTNKEVLMVVMGETVSINIIESAVLASLSAISMLIPVARGGVNTHTTFVCWASLFILFGKSLTELSRIYHINNVYIFYLISLLEGATILYKLFQKIACR